MATDRDQVLKGLKGVEVFNPKWQKENKFCKQFLAGFVRERNQTDRKLPVAYHFEKVREKVPGKFFESDRVLWVTGDSVRICKEAGDVTASYKIVQLTAVVIAQKTAALKFGAAQHDFPKIAQLQRLVEVLSALRYFHTGQQGTVEGSDAAKGGRTVRFGTGGAPPAADPGMAGSPTARMTKKVSFADASAVRAGSPDSLADTEPAVSPSSPDPLEARAGRSLFKAPEPPLHDSPASSASAPSAPRTVESEGDASPSPSASDERPCDEADTKDAVHGGDSDTPPPPAAAPAPAVLGAAGRREEYGRGDAAPAPEPHQDLEEKEEGEFEDASASSSGDAEHEEDTPMLPHGSPDKVPSFSAPSPGWAAAARKLRDAGTPGLWAVEGTLDKHEDTKEAELPSDAYSSLSSSEEQDPASPVTVSPTSADDAAPTCDATITPPIVPLHEHAISSIAAKEKNALFKKPIFREGHNGKKKGRKVLRRRGPPAASGEVGRMFTIAHRTKSVSSILSSADAAERQGSREDGGKTKHSAPAPPTVPARREGVAARASGVQPYLSPRYWRAETAPFGYPALEPAQDCGSDQSGDSPDARVEYLKMAQGAREAGGDALPSASSAGPPGSSPPTLSLASAVGTISKVLVHLQHSIDECSPSPSRSPSPPQPATLPRPGASTTAGSVTPTLRKKRAGKQAATLPPIAPPSEPACAEDAGSPTSPRSVASSTTGRSSAIVLEKKTGVVSRRTRVEAYFQPGATEDDTGVATPFSTRSAASLPTLTAHEDAEEEADGTERQRGAHAAGQRMLAEQEAVGRQVAAAEGRAVMEWIAGAEREERAAAAARAAERKAEAGAAAERAAALHAVAGAAAAAAAAAEEAALAPDSEKVCCAPPEPGAMGYYPIPPRPHTATATPARDSMFAPPPSLQGSAGSVRTSPGRSRLPLPTVKELLASPKAMPGGTPAPGIEATPPAVRQSHRVYSASPSPHAVPPTGMHSPCHTHVHVYVDPAGVGSSPPPGLALAPPGSPAWQHHHAEPAFTRAPNLRQEPPPAAPGEGAWRGAAPAALPADPGYRAQSPAAAPVAVATYSSPVHRLPSPYVVEQSAPRSAPRTGASWAEGGGSQPQLIDRHTPVDQHTPCRVAKDEYAPLSAPAAVRGASAPLEAAASRVSFGVRTESRGTYGASTTDVYDEVVYGRALSAVSSHAAQPPPSTGAASLCLHPPAASSSSAVCAAPHASQGSACPQGSTQRSRMSAPSHPGSVRSDAARDTPPRAACGAYDTYTPPALHRKQPDLSFFRNLPGTPMQSKHGP